LKLFYVGVKCCHSVREQHRLKVFEKRVLRTAFELKKEKVARAEPPQRVRPPAEKFFRALQQGQTG
jgi:hypothetical protein